MKPYYQDEAVTIYNGDCREIVPELGKFDLLLTDPPYGMDLDCDFSKMKNAGTFKGKSHGTHHEQVIGDDERFDPRPIMDLVESSESLWFGADYYADRLPRGGSWSVWDKRLGESADKMFGSCFELIWSAVPHKRKIYRVKWAGIFGMEKQDTKKRVHPTQKPLYLLNMLVSDHSDVGDTILDPFAGSGTTGRAAKDLGRKAILIEIEEKYCEIAANRMRQEVLI